MSIPSKLLATGIIAAVVWLAAGGLITMRMNAQLNSLVAACRDRNEKAQHSDSTIPWEKDPLICDPQELAALPASVGIQAQIVAAHKRLIGFKQWLPITGGAIVAASAVPFLWYFLLRRIRELSGAIVGR